jgi:asparagine synthetase B (glutamine-hydrolysing)
MELIREAVEGNLKRAGGAAVELSGGLDSSCVALAVGKAGLSLASYGIVHSGPVGKQQVARRKEVIALAGLRDMTYLARKQRTFASLERAELQITPFDDMYRPHCTAAIERLRKGGDEVDLVLTGMGGDELVKAYTTSRLDYEVAGYLASSAIVAAACRSDAFMRLGVWPKSPLLSKPIVDFCRALPEELRSQRLINVLALARAGLSDAFLFPRYHENFGFIAELSARDFDFDDFFETSAVHETGAYDITGFLIGARKATIFGFEPKFRAQLFQLCKLEVVLRNYLK